MIHPIVLWLAIAGTGLACATIAFDAGYKAEDCRPRVALAWKGLSVLCWCITGYLLFVPSRVWLAFG